MSISMRIATFFLLHGVMLSIPFALTSMSSQADAETAVPAAAVTDAAPAEELTLAAAVVN